MDEWILMVISLNNKLIKYALFNIPNGFTFLLYIVHADALFIIADMNSCVRLI